MKLSVKAMAGACAILWGGAIFLTGIFHLYCMSYSYAGAFLDTVSSIYPGFSTDGGYGNLLLGTVYGLADGAIGGALLAALYNRLAAAPSERSRR